MDLGVLKHFLRDEALSGHTTTPLIDSSPGKEAKTTNTSAAGTPSGIDSNDKNKHLTSHRLIMHIILR